MKKLIKQIILMLLGQNIGNKLIYFACYFSPKLKSYSQFGEDLIINNFFDHFNIKNGNFLDIGAYHPKFISNTYLLERRAGKVYTLRQIQLNLNYLNFLTLALK